MLARRMKNYSIYFDDYIDKDNVIQPECSLTINELKDSSFYLKTNKSPGCNEVSFNVIKHCFGVFSNLYNVFHRNARVSKL